MFSNTTDDDDPITMIDLDHDLGEYAAMGGDGIKLLDWLVQRKTFYPVRFHTQNPVGLANMKRLVNRYWKQNETAPA